MKTALHILVIGCCGQLAQALAMLTRGQRDIILTCRGRPDTDITDRGSLEFAIDDVAPHIVVNAAAWTDVDGAEKHREEALAVNATGARYLAELTAHFHLPLIHVSTDMVFSGEGSTSFQEDDETDPVNWYGETKRRGELAVVGFNPKHLILRTAWIYSPWGKNFVASMLRLATDRRHINVVSDQIGQPTDARDVARTILSLATEMHRAERSDPRWGLYHVVADGHVSRAGQARAIFETSRALGGPFAEVNDVESWAYRTPARRPLHAVMATTKLFETFGLRMPHWKAPMQACVKNVLERGGLIR